MYAPNSKWTWCFLGISVGQSLFVLAFEIYLFAVFQSLANNSSVDLYNLDDQERAAILTFLSLYIFAFLYQLMLVYNALQRQNTIQILGLVAMNIGLLVYGVLQLVTVNGSFQGLPLGLGALNGFRRLLKTIPCILGVSTCAMMFVAWKLWREFAWTILQLVSADLNMKQRYLNYQIYLTLLKFGFFYYLGFVIQYIVIVRGRFNVEYWLTIACIPVIVVTLFMAMYFMKHERLVGMSIVMILFFAGLALFIFKLAQTFSPAHDMPYLSAYRELLGFGILAIMVLLITILYAFLCMSAFGKGLKHFVNKPNVEDELDHRDRHKSVIDDYHKHRSGANIEMMNNLRARLGGYQPANNG